ncbi:7551_t:CDS:2 [Ambispora leptoticha]|uniref:7551_t:CDS:1 n=1 Tax=Ambispora leptoticha TaxID=144679 RepID=A0A9N9ARC4_9GLOM|nr:7551_t:CDS:2 [Ambispora leptoticha]
MKIGDLKALGLVHYTPVGAVEALLEVIHVLAHLPWWGSIVATTLLFRLLLFPIAVKSAQRNARLANLSPIIQKTMEQIKSAHRAKDQQTVAEKTSELQRIYRANDVHPLKMLGSGLIQAPIFISFFMALRDMCNLPVPGFRDGGIAWFTDLTMKDPYFVLPLLSSVGFIAIMEYTAHNNNQVNPTMKHVFRGLGVFSFFITASLPSAVVLYIATSSFFSMGQFALLNKKFMRHKFKIPDLIKQPTPKMPEKSFMEQMRELFAEEQQAKEENNNRRKRRRS